MNFRILIPYWGNEDRYKKLLIEWFQQALKTNLWHPVTIVTDQHTKPFGDWHWEVFKTPEYDKRYHFDHKGDIVCAAIQQITEPVLVVDSDALFQADPVSILYTLQHVPFAMPEDEGARGRKLRNRHAQEGMVAKRCAGVLWFGTGWQRAELVQEYRDAFKEMETGRYYEERRLFEQHAWSIVAFKRSAPFLPRILNWPDHITSVGPNPEAIINHRIGQRKFNIAFNPRLR